MTVYSGFEDAPVDFLASGQLGGGSDESLSFIPADSFGGASNQSLDLIPTDSFGGASDEPVSFIPASSFGGASNQAIDYIPTDSFGGASDETVPAYVANELVQPPRTQVAGRSYTQPQRDVVYRVQPAALVGINLLVGSSFSLYVAVAPYSIPVEAVILVCTLGSGITTDAVASLETNTGVVLRPPVSLAMFRQAGDVFALRPINSLAQFIPPGGGIRLVINSGASGAALQANVHLMASLV